MTLNMKNYKGYNKEPYCNAHYPTTKFTAVADTPESRRLADNTKIQSQVQYHADFEKQKGRKIEVTDDPELMRHQKNTAIMSNVSYHGVLEQKEGQEKRRQTLGDIQEGAAQASLPAQQAPQTISPQHVQQDPRGAVQQQPVHHAVSFAQQQQQQPPVQQSPQYQHQQRLSQQYNNVQPESSQRHDIGSYGGASNGNNSQYRPGGVQQHEPPPQMQPQYHQQQQQQSPLQQQQQSYPYSARSGNVGGAQTTNGGAATQGVTSGPPPSLPRPEGRVYKAIYDYQAQDGDEIGFFEGDLIINCEPIDEGWMQGMHKKSGQVGMLPANYVELVL